MCEPTIHRDSRWLLCGLVYGVRMGISALVKANRPIREGECLFRLLYAMKRCTQRPYNTFSCMMDDAIRLGKHPQIIHHTSNII